MRFFSNKAKLQLRLIFTFTLLIAIPIWHFFALPGLTSISNDFYYDAKLISIDNFYDKNISDFLGGELSLSHFFYEAIGEENGLLLMKSSFNVNKILGEWILESEKIYGIDPKTGQNLTENGNENRESFLFAPQNFNKKPFSYWFASYNEPIDLEFKHEEEIMGLKLYVYEGLIFADGTKNYVGHLPGVPEELGLEVEGVMTIWIEPLTGYLVNFKDEATNYYYDQQTKDRLYPKNTFINKYSQESVYEHAYEAKKMRQKILFLKWGIPLILILLSLMSLFKHKWRPFHFFYNSKRK